MSHPPEYQKILDERFKVSMGDCEKCGENKPLMAGKCKSCRDKSLADSMSKDYKRWSIG